MKNFNLYIPALSIIIILVLSINVKSQEVKGNGNVVKEIRKVDSFSEIVAEGVLSVYLSQGNTESIIVETDKNLQPYVITNVKGNSLIIKNKDKTDIEESTMMNVYVTLKDISKLEISGVGKVETKSQLILNELKIDNNGVGNGKLNLKCNKLVADVNSVGNLSLTGEIENAIIQLNGVGNLKAEDLKTEILRIENNGVGNANVNSNKEIYININGIGNVSYKGNAVVKEMNVSGMGKVTKL